MSLDSSEKDRFRRLRGIFRQMGGDLVFVHSDVRCAFSMKLARPFDRNRFLENHYEAVTELCDGAECWFPSFNYQFSKTGRFDMVNDPSEVGHLSEHFRTRHALWRTPVPFYSACGRSAPPEFDLREVLRPFGQNSLFESLVRHGGTILNYGCGLDRLTLIHYFESLMPSLAYRYEKTFPGQIIHDRSTSDVRCAFHVRPLQLKIEYDWPRLEQELLAIGILREDRMENRVVQVIPCRDLEGFWKQKTEADSLYFLTEESRAAVSPLLDKLGRPFRQTDFE